MMSGTPRPHQRDSNRPEPPRDEMEVFSVFTTRAADTFWGPASARPGCVVTILTLVALGRAFTTALLWCCYHYNHHQWWPECLQGGHCYPRAQMVNLPVSPRLPRLKEGHAYGLRGLWVRTCRAPLVPYFIGLCLSVPTQPYWCVGNSMGLTDRGSGYSTYRRVCSRPECSVIDQHTLEERSCVWLAGKEHWQEEKRLAGWCCLPLPR